MAAQPSCSCCLVLGWGWVCRGVNVHVRRYRLDVEGSNEALETNVGTSACPTLCDTVTTDLLVIVRRLVRSPAMQPLGTRPLSKKRSFVALGLVLLLVATVIPHQVAFVISWLMILWTSATGSKSVATPHETAPAPSNRHNPSARDALEPPIPLSSLRAPSPSPTRRRSSPEFEAPKSHPVAMAESPPPLGDGPTPMTASNDFAFVQHVLLLQAFLFPTQGAVLAVWIRTLVTAGFTTPFDGDHNIFLAVFWLVLAEAVVNGVTWKRKGSRYLRVEYETGSIIVF